MIDLTQINRLKKLTYSEKNTQNKSVVTGKEYSELLKQRYDSSQKKNVWANPGLLTQALEKRDKTEDDDSISDKYLDDEGTHQYSLLHIDCD